MFSVVIPAHNEELVVGRLLDALIDSSDAELIVVCNGCTDRTADVVAGYRPRVTLIETDLASKARALNLGDAAASYFPRCYVDADVVIGAPALRELVAAVDGDSSAMAAIPQMKVALNGRNSLVRAFFAVWTRLPFFTEGMASAGVYVLSEAARSRFRTFPDLMADDHYTLSLFSPAERVHVRHAEVVVEAPRRIWDIVRIKTRNFLGNRQLEATGLVDARQHGGRGAFVGVVSRRPYLWPAAAVYVAVTIIAEFRARHRLRHSNFAWERDESSRRSTAGP